jgi:hypothetical protein
MKEGIYYVEQYGTASISSTCGLKIKFWWTADKKVAYDFYNAFDLNINVANKDAGFSRCGDEATVQALNFKVIDEEDGSEIEKDDLCYNLDLDNQIKYSESFYEFFLKKIEDRYNKQDVELWKLDVIETLDCTEIIHPKQFVSLQNNNNAVFF